jgi:Ankyrin repeats (3 copies)
LDTFTVQQAEKDPNSVQKIFEDDPFDPLRANINAVNRNDRDQPLLYGALLSGSIDLVEYILERMSENDVRSCRDSRGNSALHIAAVAESTHPDGSRYIMQKLVEKGADKRATNKAGESILYFAFSFRDLVRCGPADIEGVKYLLENGSLEQKDDWAYIVYKLVGFNSDDWSGTKILPIIEMIMGRQFIDFYREIRGGMSLANFIATEHELCNLTEIFEPFKKRHIDLTRRDKSGKTLLELAYPSILPNTLFEVDREQCYDNIRSIRFLLEHPVDYNKESRTPGWTIRDPDTRLFNYNNGPSTLLSAQNTTWYFVRSNNVCPNEEKRYCANGADSISRSQ